MTYPGTCRDGTVSPLQSSSGVWITETKDVAYDVLVAGRRVFCQMKPIYIGPIGEGIRLGHPFQLKHHRSIRPLQHQKLVKPLPCRITLPSTQASNNHRLLEKLRLWNPAKPVQQAPFPQAPIKAAALDRAFRSWTWMIPQGRHISSLGQTCQKRKGGCGGNLDSNWKHSHSLKFRGRLHSSASSRLSNQALLP